VETLFRASLGDDWDVELIDLLEHPELAREHQVLVTPTLIRRYPKPERRIIGDFSEPDRVVAGLGLPGTRPLGESILPERGIST
jgi:circadian clock protein KaiB